MLVGNMRSIIFLIKIITNFRYIHMIQNLLASLRPKGFYDTPLSLESGAILDNMSRFMKPI